MVMIAEEPRLTEHGPLQVTYVISAFRTENAGTEGHLLRLLRQLDRTRFDPRLVVLQRSNWTDNFSDPSIPVDVLGFRSFKNPRDWRCIWALADLFKQRQTKVVELHAIDAHFVGALAARIAKIPVTISCRRDMGHQWGRKELLLAKFANRFVTRFLANSKLVANHMCDLEGIDPAKFKVIYNGIDLDAFDDELGHNVDDTFLDAIRGKRVITIAANFFPVKNHRCFLNAARMVADEVDNVVFAIMGHGALEEELRQQSAELALADKVLWLGSVPTTAPYLAHSDIACLASDAEGFSNAIVEYMAAGLPVVATRVGGAAEVIVDGKSGFLVPPNDDATLAKKLLQLLEMSNESRQALGRLGREIVEQNFTMQRQLAAYQDLYSTESQVITS